MPHSAGTPLEAPHIQCQTLDGLRTRHVAALTQNRRGRLTVGQRSYRVVMETGVGLKLYPDPDPNQGGEDPQLDLLGHVIRRLQRDDERRYPTSCRHGNGTVKLNGCATARTDGAPLYCERLAAHWLVELLSPPSYRPDYTHFSSIDALRTHVGHPAVRVQGALHHVARMRVVEQPDWGKVCAGQFKEMEVSGECIRGIYLQTNVHAFAMGLRLKKASAGGRTIYGMTLYDPNLTATHWRIKQDEIDEVEAMTASHWLVSRELAHYFDDDSTTLMMPVGVATMRALVTASRPPQPVPRRLSGALPAPTPGAVASLIDHDCVEALKQLAPAILALPDDERIRCLGRHGKVPALFVLMRRGHTDTLVQFGKLLDGLDPDTKSELLLGRAADGKTALYYAIVSGRGDLLRPYWQIVRTLPPEFHFPLMRALDGSGTSAMHWLCEHGITDMLGDMFSVLKHMPLRLRVDLAMAHSASGECGLAAAARTGHHYVFSAYGSMLYGLPSHARKEILRPLLPWVQGQATSPAFTPWTRTEARRLLWEHAPGLLLTPAGIWQSLFGSMPSQSRGTSQVNRGDVQAACLDA